MRLKRLLETRNAFVTILSVGFSAEAGFDLDEKEKAVFRLTRDRLTLSN